MVATVKHQRLALLALTSLVLLTGCYEGWENYQQQQPSSTSPATPAAPPTTSPSTRFAYILFEPISMGSDAVASATCFPKSGIRQFKTTEWTNRISAITTALNNLADVVVVKTDSIAASDCATLAAVQAAALTASPWGSNTAPTDNGSGKEIVHLKAAFWEGEPALPPPGPVTATDWAAWSTLTSEGKPTKSLLYTVISNPATGYFTQWAAAIDASLKLTGTAISSVDPTDAGATARTATINSDTSALTAWLGGQ